MVRLMAQVMYDDKYGLFANGQLDDHITEQCRAQVRKRHESDQVAISVEGAEG